MTCSKCGRCCRNIYLPKLEGREGPHPDEQFDDLLVIYAWLKDSHIKVPGETINGMWRTFCRNYRPDVGCIDYENRPPICQRFNCSGSDYRDEVEVPETLEEALRMRRKWLEETDAGQGRQEDARGAGPVDGPRLDPGEAPGGSGDEEA